MERLEYSNGFTTPGGDVAPPSPPSTNGKSEEFELFMATSIRAFDAMMDAVQGDDEESGELDGDYAPSEDGSFLRESHMSPHNMGSVPDNTVAIVGNEDMVQQVSSLVKQCFNYLMFTFALFVLGGSSIRPGR